LKFEAKISRLKNMKNMVKKGAALFIRQFQNTSFGDVSVNEVSITSFTKDGIEIIAAGKLMLAELLDPIVWTSEFRMGQWNFQFHGLTAAHSGLRAFMSALITEYAKIPVPGPWGAGTEVVSGLKAA